MRATPIPDHEIWPGAERRVFAAPDGDLTNPDIAPCEALIDLSPRTGAVNISVRCVLEAGDLEKLQAGGVVWLTFWNAMVPWALSVADADHVADYAQAGWPCILPVPPETKTPPPVGFTGAEGRDTDPLTLVQWAGDARRHSIALRMPTASSGSTSTST
jgi:hypothetical protein